MMDLDSGVSSSQTIKRFLNQFWQGLAQKLTLEEFLFWVVLSKDHHGLEEKCKRVQSTRLRKVQILQGESWESWMIKKGKEIFEIRVSLVDNVCTFFLSRQHSFNNLLSFDKSWQFSNSLDHQHSSVCRWSRIQMKLAMREKFFWLLWRNCSHSIKVHSVCHFELASKNEPKAIIKNTNNSLKEPFCSVFCAIWPAVTIC